MTALQRILLVDDDDDDIFLHTREIKKLNLKIDVVTLRDGKAALDYLKSEENVKNTNDVNLLFLDINMPCVNGWEFLDQYSKLSKSLQDRIKIFMLSTSANPNDRKRAEQSDYVYEYIQKPLTKNTIENIITKYYKPTPGDLV